MTVVAHTVRYEQIPYIFVTFRDKNPSEVKRTACMYFDEIGVFSILPSFYKNIGL